MSILIVFRRIFHVEVISKSVLFTLVLFSILCIHWLMNNPPCMISLPKHSLKKNEKQNVQGENIQSVVPFSSFCFPSYNPSEQCLVRFLSSIFSYKIKQDKNSLLPQNNKNIWIWILILQAHLTEADFPLALIGWSNWSRGWLHT